MLKKLLFIIVLISNAWFALGQSCPNLLNPVAGETDVSVTTTITWQEIIGVPSYNISIGTFPGGRDIINEAGVGTATSFTPPFGLPQNTEIFVTITLFFFSNQDNNVVCPSISFTTEEITEPPPCTQLRSPLNGQTNVSLATNLNWNLSPGATSYIVEVGTTDGGAEIFGPMDVGNILRLDLPMNLPFNTEIFVTITPINDNGEALNCQAESFFTADVELSLSCSRLLFPINGSTNVPLTPVLEWEAVNGATGYRVSLGTTPGGTEILDEGVFRTNRTSVIDFNANALIFATIIPFNDFTEATDCPEESFSTTLGCGPFLDPVSGEFISLFPRLEFSDSFVICSDSSLSLFTDVSAESIRWSSTFRLDGNVVDIISENADVIISNPGTYRLEATNLVDSNGVMVPCTSTADFMVTRIDGPIVDVDVARSGNILILTVNANGPSTYEYALNNQNGPYQDSNIFTNAPLGDNIVYVRDIIEQNCIVSEEIQADSIREGFPNFFTPNGDSTNDFWQFVQPPNTEEITLQIIRIYDRFGKLLAQIDPESVGWDGNFNGRPLPTGGYWFKAVDDMQREIQGFFTLKR